MSLEPHLRVDFKDDVVKVNLSSAGIRDEHIPEIIALLKQYPNIVSLDLSQNNLFFKDKSLLRALTALEQIQELNLGGTDFPHKGEEEAIDCLLAMPNLRSLDVRGTDISEESAKKLADKEGLLRLVLGLRQVENRRVPHKTFNEIRERFRSRMGGWTEILNKHRAELKAKKQSQQQSSIDHLNDGKVMEVAKQWDYSSREIQTSSSATFENTAPNESHSDSSGESPQQSGRSSSDTYDDLRNKQREKDASAHVSPEKMPRAEGERDDGKTVTPVSGNSPGKNS